MKSKGLVFLVPLLGLFAMAALAHAGDMVVGILEFEEKTSIGQENAGVVIPEILISHLKQIGAYKLAERVFLKKALEEQELQAAGIIDEQTAAKVGQFFGLDAFVVGSTMKVGDKISVNARLINTQTAEILTTGTIEFANIKKLNAELEELAYYLSGFSEREYRRISFRKEISKNRMGGRAGIGYGYSSSIDMDVGGGGFAGGVSVFFQSRWFDAEAECLGGSATLAITTIGIIYPFDRLGFGVGYQHYVGEGLRERDIPNQEFNEWSVNSIVFGPNFRVSSNFRIAFYLGLVLSGAIHYQSADKTVEGDFEAKTLFYDAYSITHPFMISFEYRPFEHWSIKTVFISQGANAAGTWRFIRSGGFAGTAFVGYHFAL